MTDLRARFQSLDRTEPPDLWPNIVERAGELSAPRVLVTPRLAILLAALLLLGALAAGAVGGLLRNDRDDPSDLSDRAPFAFAGPMSRPCNTSLPDQIVLRVRGNASLDAPEPFERTVYADGLVVDALSAEMGGSFNTMEAPRSARQLASGSLVMLIEAVTETAPTCRSFPFDGYASIEARGESGSHVIQFGPDPFEPRVTSEEEASAAKRTLDMLLAPDMGIPASGWADGDWVAYEPDRWRFSLAFSPRGEREAPPADGIVLPDGSSLRAFGESAVADAYGSRCVVRDAEEARQIASILTAAMGDLATEMAGQWQFADDDGLIYVTAAGLLPHETDCVTEDPGLAPSTPVPAASAEVSGAPPFDDACSYLAPADIAEVIGPLAGDMERHPGWSADWHMCWFPVEADAIVLVSTRHPVPSEHAREQAELLFGLSDLKPQALDGGELFSNGCGATDGSCRAAVAISAEPHFVVITWSGSPDALPALAERVLQSLSPAE